MLDSFSRTQRYELVNFVNSQIIRHLDITHQRQTYGGDSQDAKQDSDMMPSDITTQATATTASSSLASELGAVLEVLAGLRITLMRLRDNLQSSYNNDQAGDNGPDAHKYSVLDDYPDLAGRPLTEVEMMKKYGRVID